MARFIEEFYYGNIDLQARSINRNCLFRRGVRMRKRKYYLRLTDAEHRLILQCLFEYRNKLISQGKYTDGVDELIIKYTN